MSVVGVVLAGGAARRMGGEKAGVDLGGEPLLHRPLRALAAVTPAQAVVAKRDTRLPPLPAGVARWTEDDEPRHPLTGILAALEQAGGRAVLACAVDLPLLDAATLQRLLDADPGGTHACVVPRAAGAVEPLCALWRPAAVPLLLALGPAPRMRDAVAATAPLEVAYDDPRPFTNVNTPEGLAALAAGS